MTWPLQDDDLLYIPLAQTITIKDCDHDEDVLKSLTAFNHERPLV